MESVTVRDLRKKGSELLTRVSRGEKLMVTRDGREVAELRPLPRHSAAPAELVARRRHLPRVDPEQVRADVDATIDQTL